MSRFWLLLVLLLPVASADDHRWDIVVVPPEKVGGIGQFSTAEGWLLTENGLGYLGGTFPTYVLDLSTGTILAELPGSPVGALDRGRLYIVNDSTLMRFDPATLAIEPISTAPGELLAVANDTAFMLTIGEGAKYQITRIDAATGETEEIAESDSYVWLAVRRDGYLLLRSRPAILTAYDWHDRELWTTRIDDDKASWLHVAGSVAAGSVALVSTPAADELTAVDLTTGEIRWTRVSTLQGPGASDERAFFAHCPDTRSLLTVCAVDLQDGRELWREKALILWGDPHATGEAMLTVGTTPSAVERFDARTGEFLGQYDIPALTTLATSADGDSLYAAVMNDHASQTASVRTREVRVIAIDVGSISHPRATEAKDRDELAFVVGVALAPVILALGFAIPRWPRWKDQLARGRKP